HRRAGGDLHLPGAGDLREQSRRLRDGETRPRHPQRGGADGEIPRDPDSPTGRRDGARGGPGRPTPQSVYVENEKTQSAETESQKSAREKTQSRDQKTAGEKSESETLALHELTLPW